MRVGRTPQLIEGLSGNPVLNFAAGTKKSIAGAGNGDPSTYSAGSAAWTQTQVQSVITDLNPHYWINYVLRANGTTVPNGKFVPQFWDLDGAQYAGADAFNTTTIGVAVTEAGYDGWISFLNEPWQGTPGVNAGAVSPANAATAWDTLATDSRVLANHIHLLSPSTVDSTVGHTWMASFMGLIHKYPDAIAIHKYSGDGTTGSMSACIADTKARYPGKPLWVTEFGYLVASGPTDAQANAYMDAVIPILEADPAIQEYSWFFAGPQTTVGLTSFNLSLYDNSATVRAIGTHYKTF